MQPWPCEAWRLHKDAPESSRNSLSSPKNAARVARRAAESIADVVGKIRSTIEALVNRVPSVVGKDVKTLTRAPEFRFSRNHLHSKYKHAPDFGLNGNYNPENLDRFERILEDFLSSRSTV